MIAIAGVFILSGTAVVLAIRRCPLAKAIGLQIDQVAAAKR